MKDHSEIVGRINVVDKAIIRRLGAANPALEQRIERPLHIAGGQSAAVMKSDAMMKMKNIGSRIGNLPPLGQPGNHVELIPACHQSIEQQGVNACRVRIEPNPRIKIRRARFDDHDQRIGIGLR